MPVRAPVNELQLRSRLALFYFVYFAMLGAYAPYFGLYLQRLAFTPQQIGVLLGLVPIVRMVFPTLWDMIPHSVGTSTGRSAHLTGRRREGRSRWHDWRPDARPS